jgi:hypothetical protein
VILLMRISGPVLEGEGHGETIMDVMTHKASISDLLLFCNKFVIHRNKTE